MLVGDHLLVIDHSATAVAVRELPDRFGGKK
jgi:hypothetical protein